MLNINTGAVALTGSVLIAGVATALLWKGFIKDQLLYGNRQRHAGRRRGSGECLNLLWFVRARMFTRNSASGLPDHFTEFDNEDPITRFTDTIEKVLQKYNIDATACTQRTICMTVRDASRNVARGIGSSSEKIFDGLVRWDEFRNDDHTSSANNVIWIEFVARRGLNDWHRALQFMMQSQRPINHPTVSENIQIVDWKLPVSKIFLRKCWCNWIVESLVFKQIYYFNYRYFFRICYYYVLWIHFIVCLYFL